jgi:hypothetical protein
MLLITKSVSATSESESYFFVLLATKFLTVPRKGNTLPLIRVLSPFFSLVNFHNGLVVLCELAVAIHMELVLQFSLRNDVF